VRAAPDDANVLYTWAQFEDDAGNADQAAAIDQVGRWIPRRPMLVEVQVL